MIEYILGPKPLPPRNLTIDESTYGLILKWLPPEDETVAIAYYSVDYKSDYSTHAQWKKLNKRPIKDKYQYSGEYPKIQ